MQKYRQIPPFLSLLDYGSRHPLLACGLPLLLAVLFGVWASRSGSWLGWGLTALAILLAVAGLVLAALLSKEKR